MSDTNFFGLPGWFKTGLLGVVLAGGFIFAARVWNDEWKSRFNADYKIYSLPVPDQLNFAGEQLPLSDEELRERFDRELLTNVYWQSQTLLFIKRAEKFFPVIEPILKQNGIPDDFKFLAVAESGLQPHVVSPSNAASYWQFLAPTGKLFGLTITDEVDERYHLVRATEAACRYFKRAYAVLGNWGLVAASYNMGIEGVKKQLQQQQVNTFQDLYLNQETSRYLMRIAALKAILTQPESYGFYVAPTHHYKMEKTIPVRVKSTVMNLNDLARHFGCTYRELKYHNPWLRKPKLTVTPGAVWMIDLPYNRVNEVMLIDSDTLEYVPHPESGFIGLEHIVKDQETLQQISEQYNVPVIEIRKWNRLKSDQITPGWVLKIRKPFME